MSSFNFKKTYFGNYQKLTIVYSFKIVGYWMPTLDVKFIVPFLLALLPRKVPPQLICPTRNLNHTFHLVLLILKRWLKDIHRRDVLQIPVGFRSLVWFLDFHKY